MPGLLSLVPLCPMERPGLSAELLHFLLCFLISPWGQGQRTTLTRLTLQPFEAFLCAGNLAAPTGWGWWGGWDSLLRVLVCHLSAHVPAPPEV